MAIDLEYALTIIKDKFKIYKTDALALINKAIYIIKDVKANKSFRI